MRTLKRRSNLSEKNKKMVGGHTVSEVITKLKIHLPNVNTNINTLIGFIKKSDDFEENEVEKMNYIVGRLEAASDFIRLAEETINEIKKSKSKSKAK